MEIDDPSLSPQRPPQSSSSPDFLESFWISKSSPSFQGDSISGSTSMANFQDSPTENGRIEGLTPSLEIEENGNEDYDPNFHQPEKKRRLSPNQVKFLEKSFEVENKLEPERKVQLAKDLGLQPRQVAIWFQNRRARYKTKQLEKDYDSLKASYDKLKVDYDSLTGENAKLKLEVELLRKEVPAWQKEPELLNITNSAEPEETEKSNSGRGPSSENVMGANVIVIKHEDGSSVKSDVFDSESPNCVDGNHISLFEPVDSSRAMEPDMSEFSQDEEDDFCRILPPPCLPKLKIESFDDLSSDTCNLGNSVDDQTFWFWS